MSASIRSLFDAYVSRRSPWGPPWWVYGVTYGGLNLIRQAAILLAATEMSPPLRVASWAVTALVAIVAVNTAAVVLRRRSVHQAAEAVRAHEMAPVDPGPKREAA